MTTSIEVETEVSSLKELLTKVAKKTALGFEWELLAQNAVCKDTTDKYSLGLFAHCSCEKFKSRWTCKAKVTFSLLSDIEEETMIHSFVHTFSGTWTLPHDHWGYPEYLEFEDLLNEENGFYLDGKIRLRMDVEIISSFGTRQPITLDFFTASKFSDIALKFTEVDKTTSKVYTSKAILAQHSSVFETMFFGSLAKSQITELSIKNICANDFVGMLNVMLAGALPTDANLERLLKIADIYAVDMVLKICEDFLLSTECKLSLSKKLELASQFRLFQAESSFIASISDVNNLKLQCDGKQFEKLSDHTKISLLDRFLAPGYTY